MTAWLYLEIGDGVFDGPFFSFDELPRSALWQLDGVCLWCERPSGSGGVQFVNWEWDGLRWVTTSAAHYPVEPFRPEVLHDGVACRDIAKGKNVFSFDSVRQVHAPTGRRRIRDSMRVAV